MRALIKILFISLLFLFLNSCDNKDDEIITYTSTGIIENLNIPLCFDCPCNGSLIKIDGHGIKMFLDLPNNIMQSLYQQPLPVCVNLTWTDNLDCENVIDISEIEFINNEIDISAIQDTYNCDNLNINISESYMIIRSQEEFDNQVQSNCQTPINFELYDLVIGKKGLSNGLDFIEYILVENCFNQSLRLNVLFHLNDTTEAPNVTYYTLIPKLSENQTLELNL